MSLLLDALKRAEEAKRAKLAVDSEITPDTRENEKQATSVTSAESRAGANKDSARQVATQELRIEDYKEVISPKSPARAPFAAPPQAEPTSISELTLEVDSTAGLGTVAPTGDVPYKAGATRQPSTPRQDTTRADSAQSRETARSVFTAKQAALPEEGSGKKWLPPVIAIVLTILVAGGWYVWNEVNRVSRPSGPTLAMRPASPGALPAALPSTGQPAVGQPDTNVPKAVPEPVEPPLPPLLPPPATEAPLPVALKNDVASGPALSQREVLARSLKEAPATKEAPVALQLARSIGPQAVNTELIDAYAALKAADYTRAKALYAKLVQAEPLNLDAQIGMATVFARRGETASAVNHYRQVLAIDPRNGTAIAGILAVSDPKSPALEIELRTLVGRYPETSSLHFTLGNFYASERRWVEAQQSYFEAYRLESQNADYAYNLAVSLDQLRQSKLALDYYQKSIVLLPKSGGQFDSTAVARRIRELADQGAGN